MELITFALVTFIWSCFPLWTNAGATRADTMIRLGRDAVTHDCLIQPSLLPSIASPNHCLGCTRVTT